jgi:hypothetical protein
LTLLTIRDGSNENDCGSHVVEEAITALLAVSKTDESQSSKTHSRANGEVEIGSMRRNRYISGFTIDGIAWER